ncbi:MAG: alpha/beta fold hydrolase, partial [Solirubrobacteraceae bacterium]
MPSSEIPSSTTGVVERPGARLAYDIAGTGSGPVVVLTHGMLSSCANADELHLGMGGLAGDDLEVVRYDARGHGRSTGEADPATYTWSELAGDLLAVVDEVSPGAPVDGIGASMGSASLLTAATRAPERFRRLVVLIAPTIWDSRIPQVDGYREMRDAADEHGEAAFDVVLRSAPMPELFAGTDVHMASQVGPGLLPAVLEGAARSDLPPREAIAALPHEVLLLSWAGDPTHPVSSGELLAELIPTARLHVAETLDEVDRWPELVRA